MITPRLSKKGTVGTDTSIYLYTVQVACSGRGDTEIPRNLDEIISAARNQVVNKPIPEWFFQLLDELHEVEASVTATSINFRKAPFLQNL